MLRISILFVAIFLSLHCVAQTELLDEFTEEELQLEVSLPIGIKFDKNGFGYVWEKAGTVWLIDSSGVQSDEPLLDISDEVSSYGDHGLIDIALHPSFETNGLLYLYYTVDRHHLYHFGTPEYDPELTIDNQASIGRVARYTVEFENEEGVVDPQSREIILGKSPEDGLPVLMISHAVGSIVFGTDGSLIVSCGDGGSFSQPDLGSAPDTYYQQAIDEGILNPEENVGSYRAMMTSSLNGKLLRLDPETGSGIPSNPFYEPDDPFSNASRVWSLGFRNPYKVIRVPETGAHDISAGDPGEFLVGDVGSSYWEELNLVDSKDQWFGWPMYEGFIGNWNFNQQEIENPEAVVPEDEKESCGDLYKFEDLYVQENESGIYTFKNPCYPERNLPDDVKTYVHINPILAYSNAMWNPPAKTNVKTFIDGKVNGINIQDNSLNNEADIVDGTSLIPGDFNIYDNYPNEFSNDLFIADFHGYIFNVDFNEAMEIESIKKFLSTDEGLSHLTFNPYNGCIYYTNVLENSIRRVCYGGDIPPKVYISVDKQFGSSPLTVSFSSDNTIDYFGSGLEYQWDFGDGNSSTEANPSHTFVSTERKSYEVKLTVKDGLGSGIHQVGFCFNQ